MRCTNFARFTSFTRFVRFARFTRFTSYPSASLGQYLSMLCGSMCPMWVIATVATPPSLMALFYSILHLPRTLSHFVATSTATWTAIKTNCMHEKLILVQFAWEMTDFPYMRHTYTDFSLRSTSGYPSNPVVKFLNQADIPISDIPSMGAGNHWGLDHLVIWGTNVRYFGSVASKLRHIWLHYGQPRHSIMEIDLGDGK